MIFLRSKRKRSFPLGFPCAKMGLAYSEKGSTVSFPYLCIRANSTINSSFKWIGNANFGFVQLFCLSRLVSPWIPFSSQYPFRVRRKCHDSQSGYLELLVSLFLCVSPTKSFKESGSCGLFSLSSISSLRLRVCIRVWSSTFPGFLGVESQKLLFCCSSLIIQSFWEV